MYWNDSFNLPDLLDTELSLLPKSIRTIVFYSKDFYGMKSVKIRIQ